MRLTPERHEDRKEHCGGVIEKVSQSSMDTSLLEVPVVTPMIAKRAHFYIRFAGTDLLGGLMGIHGEPGVEKASDADNRGQ